MSSYKQRMLRARLAGTAGSMAATDAVLCRNLQPRRLEGNYTEQAYADGQEGAKLEELFDPHAGVSFETDGGIFGTIGDAVMLTHLFTSCGLVETLVEDTSATYTPAGHADTYEAAEMQFLHGDQTQTLGNARGTLSFTANAGQRPFFTFNYLGAYNAPLSGSWDTPEFTGWNFNPAATPANMSAFTVGGTTLCVSQFSFTDGRQPVVNKYMNCPGIDITRRRFTGRMQIKMPDIGSKALVEECRTGLSEALVFDLDAEASLQGRLRITGPKVQMKWAGEADIDGELGANIDLVFLPDQGDDEIAIIHMGQV